MSYIVPDYCPVCGKGTHPILTISHPAIRDMQELEAMMRRVVAEELARMFPPEEEQEQEDEAIRPFIGQD